MEYVNYKNWPTVITYGRPVCIKSIFYKINYIEWYLENKLIETLYENNISNFIVDYSSK